MLPKLRGSIAHSDLDLICVVSEVMANLQRDRAAVVLTGCRIGEYLRLDTQHLKPSIFGIDVPGTKTFGSRRTVFVAPEAWGIIVEAVPCPLQYGQMRRLWLAACAEAGVEGVTMHDLRHVSGQVSADAGVPLSAIKDHLGHATIAMAERYARRNNQKVGATALGGLVMPHVEQPDTEG